jgi:P4 family phage/plasmid primase-like protien
MDTTNQSQYRDLNEFLAKHSAKKPENASNSTTTVSPTHTRIGDKDLNIYGGSYIIPKEELPVFYKLYYPHVFTKKKPEYLTEKQQLEQGTGPILVDFDFRYNHDIERRQHTALHIQDLINLIYLELLKEFFVFEKNKSFPVYVMEKPNVNRLSDGSMTKDGIHLLIGIQMDHVMQVMLREKVMEKIPEIWELPLINTWDSVLDLGISKGTTNWQLLGSRKPNNEAYEVTQYYLITYDNLDNEFMMEEKTIAELDLPNNFHKVSAQYSGNAKFEINAKIKDEYETRKKTGSTIKAKRAASGTKLILRKVASEDDEEEEDQIALEDIKTPEILKKAIDNIMSKLDPCEFEIKTVHDYTQILPEKYYEPGSHDLNRKVAFALKQTDERLFLSWVQLRSKASDFDFSTIPDLHYKWKKYFNVKSKQDGVTKQSIMYWAKTDAFDEYMRVKKSNIDHYIDESIDSPTDFDFANVLFQMYKDKFICSELGNGGNGAVWHKFVNHHWKLDKGQTLRLAVSIEMYNIYSEKIQINMQHMQHFEAGDERYTEMQKRNRYITELSSRLKKTNDKNNILREASVLFFNYNEDFVKKMDSNKYLMCFTNGVVDFKNSEFRDGNPEDCITKTTCIPYVDIGRTDLLKEEQLTMMVEINTCLEQIFPLPELKRYVIDHLSSALIGENINQTFNIYHGSGSNGKSVLTDLMAHTLGDYKGTVPISMITEKRASVGGLAPEIVALKGVRYAVMQEPSKEMKINEGFMKELTGGDPLTGRTLFRESETFIPQFDLAVCTNNLFEINSNDDGTWRRIRIIKFLSKFLDSMEMNNPLYSECKYKYSKDKNLKEKYPDWAPLFGGMLVKRAFETKGIVEDCELVLEESNNYRRGQDHISGFVSEMIESKPGSKIMRKELFEEFKTWFTETHGSRKIPKGMELYDYMDKKFGKAKKDGWHNVSIIYPDTDEMVDMSNY